MPSVAERMTAAGFTPAEVDAERAKQAGQMVAAGFHPLEIEEQLTKDFGSSQPREPESMMALAQKALQPSQIVDQTFGRPVYAYNNILQSNLNQETGAPPITSFPQYLKERIGEPAKQGFLLQQKPTEMGILQTAINRLRGQSATAPKTDGFAVRAGGIAAGFANPVGWLTGEAVGGITKAVAATAPAKALGNAILERTPNFLREEAGAPAGVRDLLEQRRTNISEQGAQIVEQGKALSALTPQEQLRTEAIVRGAAPGPQDAALVAVANPVRQNLDRLGASWAEDVAKAGFVGPKTREQLIQKIQANAGKYFPDMWRLFEKAANLPRLPGTDVAALFDLTPQQAKALEMLTPEGYAAFRATQARVAERAAQGGSGFGSRGLRMNPANVKVKTLTVEHFAGGKMVTPEDQTRLERVIQLYKDALGGNVAPGYAYVKKGLGLLNDIETAKMMTTISRNPAWVSDVERAGWVQLDSNPRNFGPLAGKFVPPSIEENLTALRRVDSPWRQQWSKELGEWKFLHTAAVPSVTMGNTMGNIMQSDFRGTDLITQARLLIPMIRAYKKGLSVYIEARKAGAIRGQYFGAELDELARQADLMSPRETFGPWTMGDASSRLIRFAMAPYRLGRERLSNYYQASENVWKMINYAAERERGASMQEAAKAAQDAIFNYGVVSPLVRWSRQAPVGSPFATYTAKVLPLLASTAIFEPWRIAKYQMLFNNLDREAQAKFNLTDREMARLKAPFPGAAVVLPTTDSTNRPLVMNISYRIPWGNFTETGPIDGVPETFTPSGPMRTVAEALVGEDLYRRGLGKPANFRQMGEGKPHTSTPAQATVEHLFRGLLSPLLPGVPGVTGPTVRPPKTPQELYAELHPQMAPHGFTNQEIRQQADKEAEQESGIGGEVRRWLEAQAHQGGYSMSKLAAALSNRPDFSGRVRSLGLTLADVFAGVKIVPVDEELQRQLEIHGAEKTKQTLEHEGKSIMADKTLNSGVKRELLKGIMQEFEQLRNTKPGQRQ